MLRSWCEVRRRPCSEADEPEQPPTMIKNRVLERATAYVRDALAAWLEEGAETSYAAQENDILTTIGFRPANRLFTKRIGFQE